MALLCGVCFCLLHSTGLQLWSIPLPEDQPQFSLLSWPAHNHSDTTLCWPRQFVGEFNDEFVDRRDKWRISAIYSSGISLPIDCSLQWLKTIISYLSQFCELSGLSWKVLLHLLSAGAAVCGGLTESSHPRWRSHMSGSCQLGPRLGLSTGSHGFSMYLLRMIWTPCSMAAGCHGGSSPSVQKQKFPPSRTQPPKLT